MQIFFFILVIGLATISSCGNKIITPKNKNFVFQNSYSGSPLFLRKQIKNCQRGNEVQSTEFNLNLFLNGYQQQVVKDLNDVSPKTISGAYYGEELIIYRSLRNGSSAKKIEGKVADICPTNSEYSVDTVESATLNTTYYITKTYNKIKEVDPSIILGPVRVSVSPKWTEIKELQQTGKNIQREVKIHTDNAYYNSVDQAIYFLPHSNEKKMECFSMNLWEIPSVISHEYGHHLFFHLFKAAGLGLDSHSCYESEFASDTNQTLSGSLTQIISSLNEGFADLVSFYSLPVGERGFQGIPCIESIRDLTSARFPGGNWKVFNDMTLLQIFPERGDLSYELDHYVNYQDTHTIGAVFAYSADHLLSYMKATNDQKLKVLLDWLKQLNLKHSTLRNRSAKEYLKQSYLLFTRTALKNLNMDFSPGVCSKISQVFYGLVEQIPECSVGFDS